MLQAQLKGKLTRSEGLLEDVLTSDLFGSLKYVPPAEGLALVLHAAVREDGTRPLDGIRISSAPIYQFWPPTQATGCKFCEPDAMITIPSSSMGKLLLLIEVKYLSGKSSFMNDGPLPNDQLAREWDNLVGLIAESDGMENAIPYLLYVTADFGFPSKDVEEARTEFAMKRLGRRQPDVLWIPWRQLPEILSQSNQEILRDVSMVLIGLGLIPFKGVRVPETIAFSWSFSRTYHWSRVGFTYVGWRFKDKSVQKQADTMEKQTWGEER